MTWTLWGLLIWFPDPVASIECVILSLGAFEKVKLYKARDFS
jgi:hypothetical protein